MNSLLCALVLTSGWAEVPLPDGLTLNTDTSSEVSFGDATVYEGTKARAVRGHRWRSYAASQSAGAALWATWRPLLTAAGWRLTSDENGHSLMKSQGKKELRLIVTTPDYDVPLLLLVEVGGSPMKLALKPPGPKPVTTKDDEDFPFAPNFPGQVRTGSVHSAAPFIVAVGTPDARFIADSAEVKTYQAPRSLSRLEAVLAAAEALKRAGWDLAFVNEEDGYVQAHYAKQGHDLWLHVSHREDGTEQALSVAVVDLGADDPGRELDRACTLTLRGVHFDFNLATLRPDSEGALQAVARALASRTALKIEVQGHTDAVGDDASNLKLSEARAASVATWLTAHGVSSSRLTARGFGETQPVADNDSDAGRAKNRRVELKCVK